MWLKEGDTSVSEKIYNLRQLSSMKNRRKKKDTYFKVRITSLCQLVVGVEGQKL